MKLGKEYIIDFWDHASYEDDDVGPIESRVRGRLVALSKLSYEIEMLTFKSGSGNMRFSVLRTTITKVKEVK